MWFTGESPRTDAVEGVDGVDGPEEHRRRRDEAGRVPELEDRHALLKVETWLDHAQVVVKRQNLQCIGSKTFELSYFVPNKEVRGSWAEQESKQVVADESCSSQQREARKYQSSST